MNIERAEVGAPWRCVGADQPEAGKKTPQVSHPKAEDVHLLLMVSCSMMTKFLLFLLLLLFNLRFV